MKDFKITEAMSIEDQKNIIKNIKMVLDQLPAAKAQMKASGASEQDIRNFQSPILKFLDDAKREMESTEGDEAIAAARKELGGMFEEKIKKMENLNEGKNKKGKMTYEAALREIDAQSAIVAMEAKIEKLKEMAEAKETRLNMVSEDENLSELIDKRAMNEMKKEIKQIKKMQEKLERLYEKKNGKKPEVIDEDEEMNEGGYGMPSYEEDDDKPSMEEEKELDEAHCNTEEDDTDSMKEEEVNEEFLRMQKLAGIISEEEYKNQVNELFGIGKGKKNEWHFANQFQGSDNDYMYYGTLKGPKNGKDEKGADKAMDKHIDQIRRGAVLILAEPGYRGFNGKKTAGEISDDPKVISTKTYMYNR